MLGALGTLLETSVCENNSLRVIHCSRPIDESIKSLQKRFPNRRPEAVKNHQLFIRDKTQELLNILPPERKMEVEYDDLLSHTDGVIERLIDFMKIKPFEEQIAMARQYPDASKRHVKLQ